MDHSGYSNEVFCVKCYPSLYNFTVGLSSANRYHLSDMVDLKNVDSCDETSFDRNSVKNKVIKVGEHNSAFNSPSIFLNGVQSLD